MEKPKCLLIDEWLKKVLYILCMYKWRQSLFQTHTHNRILFSLKMKQILPFTTTCMDFEGIMLTKISHTEKDKNCMISLIY